MAEMRAWLLALLAVPWTQGSPGNDRDFAASVRTWTEAAARRPKDALPHIMLSEALLQIGLGQSARDEARIAVKLAPQDPEAHRALGIALGCDLHGRRYFKGADVEGAAAALRKAKELDPKNLFPRIALADLFLHTAGRWNDAAAEYAAIRKDFPDGWHNPYAAIALLRVGRYAEAIKVADAGRAAAPRDSPRVAIAAAAAADNRAEVRRRAAALEEPIRIPTLEEASRLLVEHRLYPAAAMIMEEVTGSDLRHPQWALTLRQLKRYEELLLPPGDAIGVVQRQLVAAFASETGDANVPPIWMLRASQSGLGPEVLADMLLSPTTFDKEGDDAVGWRVRMRAASPTAVPLHFYLVREGGALRIIATSVRRSALGERAKSALAAGDEAAARRWLGWAREDGAEQIDADPLSGRPLARLWNVGAPRDRIEPAIAALLAEDKATAASALPALSACTDPACQVALVGAYLSAGQPALALRVAERLAGQFPQSKIGFRLHAAALLRLGRTQELLRLTSQSTDREQLLFRGRALMAAGKGSGYEQVLARLIREGRAEATDYNSAAWVSLFLRTATDADIALARRAVELTYRRSRNILNTLAAVLADAGKLGEANRVLCESWLLVPSVGPESGDFYVMGRIAEHLGRRTEAIALYEKEPRPDTSADLTLSAYQLAAKRLAALR